MPTPDEIEAAAGIEPTDEVERKRIWAAAQVRASDEGRAPSADDLRLAEAMLGAARATEAEHLSDGRGRAVITLVDVDDDEFQVSVQFDPEPVEISEEEIELTPAQSVALQLLDALSGEADEHDHDH